MRIYVDGNEQPVQIVSGVQNPSGEALRQNEIYIGHDSIIQIDELKISNLLKDQILSGCSGGLGIIVVFGAVS
jgi:hypothetical protein